MPPLIHAGHEQSTRCFWCSADPVEAAARHEGTHATWCVHYQGAAVRDFTRVLRDKGMLDKDGKVKR